jgi:1,4-dihydroxy-2-naphthoate octaprenyltransferase
MPMRILRLSRPLAALFLTLTYCLGAGISRYLGHPFSLAAFGLGWLALLSMQLAFFWALDYFRLPLTPLAPEETPRQRERFRTLLLQSAYAALTLAGACAVTLVLTHTISLPAGILLLLALLFLFAYGVPPLRLAEKGYGELILAVSWGTLIPAFAFLLQTDAYHRLLPIVTFPLTLMALAYLLAADFSTFASDSKLGRNSLLTRLTWQRAIPIHHLLLLFSFLLLAAAPFFGVPWGLVWPVFLALPFAGLQIYWLQRIAVGGSPFWKFMDVLVPSVFGLAAYLLTLAFWLR